MDRYGLIFELLTAATSLDQLSEVEVSSLLKRAIGYMQEICPPTLPTLPDGTRQEVIALLTSPTTVASLPRDLIQIYLLDAADLIREWLKVDWPSGLQLAAAADTVH